MKDIDGGTYESPAIADFSGMTLCKADEASNVKTFDEDFQKLEGFNIIGV
ncbi:MAG: hypothetical protein QXU47_07050 [Candidatus Bathyarchaeia archaeon]